MAQRVSCPVFRCTSTSIAQCTGYRRACERYYCQTHTKGTLCERCAGLKQEDMKSGYRQMLKSLERRAYSPSRNVGALSLVVIALLLFVAAIYFIFSHGNHPSYSTLIGVTLISSFLFFFGGLFWYVTSAREYMRAESIELDLAHPGFYDYYWQWQRKIEEITHSSPPLT